MRRMIMVMFIGAIGALSSGCLAVVAHRGSGSERERVVVKDGDFYVVDLDTNTARRVAITESDEIETMDRD